MKNEKAVPPRKFKVFVKTEAGWIDVSDMRVAVYGAGLGCIELMNELMLPNVDYVIDGNALTNQKIMLLGRIYDVDSPDILEQIDEKEVYIVISSEKFYESIVADIRRKTTRKFIVYSWKSGLQIQYSSLEEMIMNDYIVQKRLAFSGLTRKTDDVQKSFNELVDTFKVKPTIDRFIPLRTGGSKFSFVFGNEKEKWVFHHEGGISSRDIRIIDRENKINKQIRWEYILDNKLDEDITVARNKNGAIIQIYAGESIDYFDKEIQKKIIEKCKKLHGRETGNLPINNFTNSFFYDYCNRINGVNLSNDIKTIIESGKCKAKAIDEYTADYVPIHGDLTYENIVANDNEIFLIDWEFLSQGIAEIDICYYLFSIYNARYIKGKISYYNMCILCFKELSDLLRMYYEEKYNKEVLTIAEIIMDIFLIRDIMQSFSYNPLLGEKKSAEYIMIRN